MSWVLEFRSGSYFKSPEADRGCPLSLAMRFSSEEEARKYFTGHIWVWLCGGMLVKCE